MASYSNHQPHHPEIINTGNADRIVDYQWFATQFDGLLERLAALETSVTAIEQTALANDGHTNSATPREYYSVPEFADLVERNVYTVREWCRLERINAEKCETGRGEAKNWKIPADELQRYRDHGLLPQTYLR